jgi:hypothetical protein
MLFVLVIPMAERVATRARQETYTARRARGPVLLIVASPNPTEVGWVGDAASKYGVGVLIGKKWARLKAVKGWTEGKTGTRGIAWMETVAIRVALLLLRKLGAVRGKCFIVWTDNTTAKNAVHKRKTHDRHANEEWKRIQSLLIDMQIDIVAKQVASKDNRVDGLSRGKTGKHSYKDRVFIDVPEDLSLYFTQ